LSRLNLSSVQDKIPDISFDLFRYWSKEIGINESIIVKTEQVLVKDFEASLTNAIIALNERSESDRKKPGWETGFIIGFVNGNLGKHWYNEYVVKRSEEYKTFVALQVIEYYLKFDTVCKIKVDNIYETLIASNTNIQNLKIGSNKLDLDMEKFTVREVEGNGKVTTILKKQILKINAHIAKLKNNVALPVDDFLSREAVEKLIEDNAI